MNKQAKIKSVKKQIKAAEHTLRTQYIGDATSAMKRLDDLHQRLRVLTRIKSDPGVNGEWIN